MYAAKFGIDEQKLMRKLWGDSFYNPKTKKWNKDATEGGVRAFCQFVLDTILKVEYITMHARLIVMLLFIRMIEVIKNSLCLIMYNALKFVVSNNMYPTYS